MHIWYHQQTRAVQHISEPPFTETPPAGYAITEIADAPFPGDSRWLRLSADLSQLEVDTDRAPSVEQVALAAFHQVRAAAYPSFADQFDTLFHEGYEGWKATIQAVKTQYPKHTE